MRAGTAACGAASSGGVSALRLVADAALPVDRRSVVEVATAALARHGNDAAPIGLDVRFVDQPSVLAAELRDASSGGVPVVLVPGQLASEGLADEVAASGPGVVWLDLEAALEARPAYLAPTAGTGGSSGNAT